MEKKTSYSYEELISCGNGELFGPGNAKLPLPPMLMFDRITEIKDKKINLIINTTEGKQSIEESFSIRAEAVISGITYYTSLEAAFATIESFDFLGTININKLQNYLNT